MSCNDSEVTFSKPDMNDDNWIRGSAEQACKAVLDTFRVVQP